MTFVYAGPPTSIRGVDVLIRAFARAARVHPTIRLECLLRVDGAEQTASIATLRSLADSVGVRSRTSFVVGTLTPPDLRRHLEGADVIVLPFRLVPSEGPLTVMEAAAAGKPLISTNLAPIRALSAPGSTLVVAGSVPDLAEAILALASDGDTRMQMAARAREHYLHLPTWDDVTDSILALATPTDGSNRPLGPHAGHAPKRYASVSLPALAPILSTTPGQMVSHWMFQGVLYMDSTERRFKLGSDLVAAALVMTITRPFVRSIAWRTALALVTAHSANFVLNSHALAGTKWHGRRFSRAACDAFMPGMARRLGGTKGVQKVLVYGSFSRGQESDSSDVDVRVLRQPGPLNGLRVCWAVAIERFRAMTQGVPLDIFVWDSMDRAASMRADERPIDLSEWR